MGRVDGLVQDCSVSIADTLEILQSCTKPSMFAWTTAEYVFVLVISSVCEKLNNI